MAALDGETNGRGLKMTVWFWGWEVSSAARLSDWFGQEERLDTEQALTSLCWAASLSQGHGPGPRGEVVAAVEMKREIKSQEVKQNSHFNHHRQVLWSKKQDLKGF